MFFNIGQVPSPSKGQRPPYGRSVSENYQVLTVCVCACVCVCVCVCVYMCVVCECTCVRVCVSVSICIISRIEDLSHCNFAVHVG